MASGIFSENMVDLPIDLLHLRAYCPGGDCYGNQTASAAHHGGSAPEPGSQALPPLRLHQHQALFSPRPEGNGLPCAGQLRGGKYEINEKLKMES